MRPPAIVLRGAPLVQIVWFVRSRRHSLVTLVLRGVPSGARAESTRISPVPPSIICAGASWS